MNILFFLTPKAVCAYVRAEDSIRQALERMEISGFSALPILTKDGRYCGTLTEGDLLWAITNRNLADKYSMERVGILEIDRRKDYGAVSVNTNIEDLMHKAVEQNFIAVVDDRDSFIGIVTRKAILQYCVDQYIHGKETAKKKDPVIASWSYRI